MKLTIHNLAKIHDAALEINGITLICGANDSGKSTCGKALCALVNAFTQLKERGLSIRKERLARVFGLAFDSRQAFNLESDWIEDYLSGRISADVCIGRFLEEENDSSDSDDDSQIEIRSDARETLVKRLEEVRLVPELELYGEAVQRCFSTAFNRQYVSLDKTDSGHGDPVVTLADGSRMLSVTLRKDVASLSSIDIPFQCKAWYVDDPSVVAQLPPLHFYRWRGRDQFGTVLLHDIYKGLDRDEHDPVAGALDGNLLRKKLLLLARLFDQTLQGKVVFDKGKGFVLSRPQWTEPLLLANASMGLKGFALIRIMLDAQILREGDVLVLDEPEVHLHPDWQIIYAELIVLLNKVLGIKVLLTTHSPDFIRAIQLYSQTHQTYDTVNAYLSEGDGLVSIRPVKEWNELYERFAPMMRTMDRIENELVAEGKFHET